MRTVRATVLTVLLTAVTVGFAATGAYASAEGAVTGLRGEGDTTAQLSFKASGTPTQAKGHFTYQEPRGYTVKGKVTCYYQEGNRAVLTGPVREKPFTTGTEAFVIWVMDGPSTSTGNPEGFDVAGTSLSGAADCQNNFPLDRFDFLDPSQYFVVTSGDIRIQ